MKYLSTKKGVITVLVIIAFLFTIMVIVNADSWNARLSLAFTTIASVSTVGTLLIALQLYDRFGSKSADILKKTERIYQLYDLLKDERFYTENGGMRWRLSFDLENLTQIKETEIFKADAQKKILIDFVNYDTLYQKLNPLRTSHWLPADFFNALNFLVVGLTADVEFEDSEYIKLRFSDNEKIEEWVAIIPEQTFGQFVDNLINLLELFEKWNKEHHIDHPFRLRY